MIVYVTKYATSEGIRRVETDEPEIDYKELRYRWKYYTSTAKAGEYFESLAEAQADAERRRAARIAALEEQIDNLRNKKIKVRENRST